MFLRCANLGVLRTGQARVRASGEVAAPADPEMRSPKTTTARNFSWPPLLLLLAPLSLTLTHTPYEPPSVGVGVGVWVGGVGVFVGVRVGV